MPNPTTTLLADMRYVFACIHDREPRGGHGYYDHTGHYTPVTNLGWLRAHSAEVEDLWVSTSRFKSLAMGGGPPYGRTNHDGFDAILAARLTNGRVYVATWQDRTILHDWLARGDKWRGRPVHWDCVAYIVDSRDYHRMMWEWRKRCERERTTRGALIFHIYERTGGES